MKYLKKGFIILVAFFAITPVFADVTAINPAEKTAPPPPAATGTLGTAPDIGGVGQPVVGTHNAAPNGKVPPSIPGKTLAPVNGKGNAVETPPPPPKQNSVPHQALGGAAQKPAMGPIPGSHMAPKIPAPAGTPAAGTLIAP